jgi:hypothetical protein
MVFWKGIWVKPEAFGPVYVSFHNQGVYSFRANGQNLTPICQGDTCLRANGQIALWNGGLLVTTGSRSSTSSPWRAQWSASSTPISNATT